MKNLLISAVFFFASASVALAQVQNCETFDGTNGVVGNRNSFSVDLLSGETITADTTTPTSTNMEIGNVLCGPAFGSGTC